MMDFESSQKIEEETGMKLARFMDYNRIELVKELSDLIKDTFNLCNELYDTDKECYKYIIKYILHEKEVISVIDTLSLSLTGIELVKVQLENKTPYIIIEPKSYSLYAYPDLEMKVLMNIINSTICNLKAINEFHQFYNLYKSLSESTLSGLTKDQAVNFIKKYPYIGISHKYFSSDEYLYSKESKCVYDENEYLFEDWIPYSNNDPTPHLRKHGLADRSGATWNDGWRLIGILVKEGKIEV